ncbi:cancer/testis antigen 55 [Otolemur garnettii]|uniref:cancer/testis antigen 55 n=1 Tax=Otolemur garnettii TaxID=30611 RepID=UPI000C7ECC6E|nr:cancer/testis antigen 55 [Otolemur garnettii]
MLRFLGRVLSFFQRRAGRTQTRCLPQLEVSEDEMELKTMQGVVTSFFTDYGLINESIYFSTDVVTRSMPITVGQKVSAVIEEDKMTHALKALRVDVIMDHHGGVASSDPETRVVIGYVTSINKDIIYLNKNIEFSVNIVSEGFVPYKGDWLEVECSVDPSTSELKPFSVKPVSCKHVDEVCITNLQGRNGVIDDTIFFTLDSVKLPCGYIPQRFDFVNVVMVESIQSCFIWRAVSVTPVQRSGFWDGSGLGRP